jgi:hypothetical protein
MNLLQLLRRVCYGLWSTRSAALGAAAYLLLLMAALAVLHVEGLLGLGSGYAALGGVSASVSLGFWWRLRRAEDSAAPPAFADVVQAHLGFARYGVGTALLGWVPQNVWYLVLPLVLPGSAQLEPSGHLRALVNLVQPMLQVNGALGTLLVPTFARQASASPWRFTCFMTALSALYAPALVLLGPLANRVLYRGAYPSDAATWCVLGAVPACFAFYTGLRSYCVARARPNLPLWATAVAALGSLSVGVWLCAWRPLFGSALAMLQGFALQGVCLFWLVQRRSAQSARPSSERAA